MYTLTTNKKLRLFTLCILYFAQGFPWGFMLTALISFLASKGLTMVESGQLTAMAYLPWTFKLFWGPLIDSFGYRYMGKRRPWIIFAQSGMLVTLLIMCFIGDLLNNLQNISSGLFFLEENTKLLTINTHLFEIGASENVSFNQSHKIKKKKHVKNILKAFALDTFCHEMNFWPHYIKCDIDGNEIAVLKGSKKTLLNKNFKSMHIEFMDTTIFDGKLSKIKFSSDR